MIKQSGSLQTYVPDLETPHTQSPEGLREKKQEKWTVVEKLQACKEKGHGSMRENIWKHLQITNIVRAGFMLLSFKGVLTLDLDLYFTWCFIMLNAFVLQPRLLHVSSVGEDVGQVSHAPAIMSRLAQRHEYSLWSLVSLYMIPPYLGISHGNACISNLTIQRIMLLRNSENVKSQNFGLFQVPQSCRLPGMSHSSMSRCLQKKGNFTAATSSSWQVLPSHRLDIFFPHPPLN